MGEREKIRVAVKEGYNLWAESYDATPNPLVSLDTRHTIHHLSPSEGERILDVGCGTGRNIGPLLEAESDVTGVDFSDGMVNVARQKFPQVDFHVHALDELPDSLGRFNAILCALVGEHLTDLHATFKSLIHVLDPDGRMTFSVYHPWLAEAGKEANFTLGDREYRLGAETHTIADYTEAMQAVGFSQINTTIYNVDQALIEEVPAAEKYLDRPLLVVIESHRR